MPPDWRKVTFKHILGTDAEKRELVECLVPQRLNVFNTLRTLASKIGADGLDLLQKMLEIDPDKRISSSEALAHPYFNH